MSSGTLPVSCLEEHEKGQVYYSNEDPIGKMIKEETDDSAHGILARDFLSLLGLNTILTSPV